MEQISTKSALFHGRISMELHGTVPPTVDGNQL